MKFRVAVGLLALCAGATGVVAQSEPVKQRRAEMKAMSPHIYRSLARMERGQDPFDATKVEAAFKQIAASAQKLQGLFPEGSISGTDPGDEFRTSEKIWQDKADFNGRLVKLARDATENLEKSKTLDGLKSVYPTLRQTCDSCHETYLIKN